MPMPPRDEKGPSSTAAPAPANMPSILFFSGGTALKSASQELARVGAGSVHLITPFDSGGSSAALRRAFSMPAVGDLRSRIMALADVKRRGNPEIYTLFSYRLPKNDSEKQLTAEMARLVRGSHPLMRQVPEPMNGIIREHLAWFALQMPVHFPLAGANVGNLVLAAGYLRNKRRLAPVIALVSRMVGARGIVRPIVEATAHLAVRLESGDIIVGQHRFTGKEKERIPSPIKDIWLCETEENSEPVQLSIRPRTAKLIRSAPALCYPMGSFYSSLVANLLPGGVGRAVADNPGPKTYVPNLGDDPESAGLSLKQLTEALLRPLLNDAPGSAPRDLLTHILVDERGNYPGGIPDRHFNNLGITILRAPLVAEGKSPLADPRLLNAALFRACGG